jgi:hypothetical protein
VSIYSLKLLERVTVELVQGYLESEETDVIINLTDAKLKNEGI